MNPPVCLFVRARVGERSVNPVDLPEPFPYTRTVRSVPVGDITDFGKE